MYLLVGYNYLNNRYSLEILLLSKYGSHIEITNLLNSELELILLPLCLLLCSPSSSTLGVGSSLPCISLAHLSSLVSSFIMSSSSCPLFYSLLFSSIYVRMNRSVVTQESCHTVTVKLIHLQLLFFADHLLPLTASLSIVCTC